MNKSCFWGPGPRFPIRISLLAGIISIAGLILGLGAATAAAPRVTVSETSHDFGKVFEDRALSYTFVIKNEGDAPLKVEDVDPDCACTVPRYDRVIPPRSQGEVTLTLKPYSVLRDFRKETKVKFNDPSRPELTLVLHGYVQPIIEIQPSHIVRLRGGVNDEVRGQVRFISHQSGPWEIQKVENGIPGMVEVNLKAEQPGKVYVLEVRNIRKEAGHYAGKIELITSSKERPRLIVRVFANLYPSTSGPGAL